MLKTGSFEYKPLYTLPEVARILGTNDAYVQNLRKAGLIRCLRIGHYKVRYEELERFLSDYENKDTTDPFNVKELPYGKSI